MASSRPPLAKETVPDEIWDIANAWRGLIEASNAGDVRAAVFLQKFAPWAREQLDLWELT